VTSPTTTPPVTPPAARDDSVYATAKGPNDHIELLRGIAARIHRAAERTAAGRDIVLAEHEPEEEPTPPPPKRYVLESNASQLIQILI
jgi:hypothetical protein